MLTLELHRPRGERIFLSLIYYAALCNCTGIFKFKDQWGRR